MLILVPFFIKAKIEINIEDVVVVKVCLVEKRQINDDVITCNAAKNKL